MSAVETTHRLSTAKRILKVLRNILLGFLALIVLAVLGFYAYYGISSSRNLAKVENIAPIVIEDGASFRDLNKNGLVDRYEDYRVPQEDRIEDLISQMTIEEKAGQMFVMMAAMGEDGSLLERPTPANPFSFMLPINSDLVANKNLSHFNVMQVYGPREVAIWQNTMQRLAEGTRLGIPITFGSDPRHAFSNNPIANLSSGRFSKWPEPTGLAATRDTALVRNFGDIARKEYLAVGFRLALHPMADLATEPRWARVNGTFGEDATLSAQMTYAYIKGFQGDTLTRRALRR